MRMPHKLALAALALGLNACAYDFDAICREDEICDPDSLALPRVGEPAIPHVAACQMLLGTCTGVSTSTACDFTITGDNVDAEPECRTVSGSVSRDRPCSETMGCSRGLTCVRPAAGAPGLCRDLCTTAMECMASSSGDPLTCDRSRRIATIGGVPLFACAPVTNTPERSR